MEIIDINTSVFKTKYDKFIDLCNSVEKKQQWNKEDFGEMEVFYVTDLMSIIIRLVAVDGNISQKEVEYFNKTFGFECTLEELIDIYNNSIENIDGKFEANFVKGLDLLKKIDEELADLYKELLIMICEIIICSDDVKNPEEIKEFERLKEMIEE